MSPAKKFRPNWDYASFVMRTDVEHERRPRLPATVIKLPQRVRLDPARAVAAWADIGLTIDESRIRFHLAVIQRWQRRIKSKS